MVKKLLLKFVRKFYDPNLTYIEKLLNDWAKKLVQFIIDIIFNGVIAYIAIAGLIFIFPWLFPYIFLGSAYWHIPLAIFYLGILRWFLEELYTFLRKGGKK